MIDREKIIKAMERALAVSKAVDGEFIYITCGEAEQALELLKAEETRRTNMLRSWKMIKFSVLDTAHNNADAGNEDFYKLLTWVAHMMDQQEAKWDD